MKQSWNTVPPVGELYLQHPSKPVPRTPVESLEGEQKLCHGVMR